MSDQQRKSASALGGAGPDAIASLLVATADLVVVLDPDDVIEDVSATLDDGHRIGLDGWRGRPFRQVVSAQSPYPVEQALERVRRSSGATRFETAHAGRDGIVLPVEYAAISVSAGKGIVLAGRDLRPLEQLRAAAEDSRLHSDRTEAQYRALFDISADATLVVDAATGAIARINREAVRMLGLDAATLAGRPASSLFAPSWRAMVGARLRGVRASARSDSFQAELSGGARVSVSLHPMGDTSAPTLMLRLAVVDAQGAQAAEPDVGAVIRASEDWVVLTEDDGTIVWANDAFMAAAQLPLAATVAGRFLHDFVRPLGGRTDDLLQRLRADRRVRLPAVEVRGVVGSARRAELSGMSLPGSSPELMAFVMRAASGTSHAPGTAIAGDLEAMLELVGRVPMKDLVRDTTDAIEKMCIEAALGLTGNNRAAAARVLGLSRQALYLKLERHGIGDA
jgi:transcriptional regulator PpsR